MFKNQNKIFDFFSVIYLNHLFCLKNMLPYIIVEVKHEISDTYFKRRRIIR